MSFRSETRTKCPPNITVCPTSIPNALLVDLGFDAVQPRSKVGIWNFAVVDMSFGQSNRDKAGLLRQNLTAGIGAVADTA